MDNYDVKITMDPAFKAIMESPQKLFKSGVDAGISAAAAEALDQVDANWGKWPGNASLQPAYRERKMQGKVAPGHQLPSTAAGMKDFMLTGALRHAAVFVPEVQRPNFRTIVIKPNTGVSKGGKSTVGHYANRRYNDINFYKLSTAQIQRVSARFAQVFAEVLSGKRPILGWLYRTRKA